MNVLVVYASPEDKSFGQAMKRTAVAVLSNGVHEVKVTDLYAMDFNPVVSSKDFTARKDEGYMNYMLEQRNASENDAFAADIKEEQEKVAWADLIIFQFPIYWFSCPAIVKGWFDRVLSCGFAWEFGKFYDKGLLRGKKAMLSVTTGGPEELYKKDGVHKTTMEEILFPITHGTLYFCGMEVLEPFIAWSTFQADIKGRKQFIMKYEKELMEIENRATMDGHSF